MAVSRRRDVDVIGQGAGVAYGSSLRRLAKALSLEFDDVTVTAEVATATKPVETAVGTIDAGTVAAWRIEISGIRDGKPLMQMVPTWYLTTDLESAWNIPFPGQGWHVIIEGDLPLDISIRFAWPTPEAGRPSGLRQCQPSRERGAQRLRSTTRHLVHVYIAPNHFET